VGEPSPTACALVSNGLNEIISVVADHLVVQTTEKQRELCSRTGIWLQIKNTQLAVSSVSKGGDRMLGVRLAVYETLRLLSVPLS